MYKNDLITSYVYEVNIIKIKCVVYVIYKNERKLKEYLGCIFFS